MMKQLFTLCICASLTFSAGNVSGMRPLATTPLAKLKNEASQYIKTIKTGQARNTLELEKRVKEIIQIVEPSSSGTANQLRKDLMNALNESVNTKRAKFIRPEKQEEEEEEEGQEEQVGQEQGERADLCVAYEESTKHMLNLFGRPDKPETLPLIDKPESVKEIPLVFAEYAHTILSQMYPASTNTIVNPQNFILSLGSDYSTLIDDFTDNAGTLFWTYQFFRIFFFPVVAPIAAQGSSLCARECLKNLSFRTFDILYNMYPNDTTNGIKVGSGGDLLIGKGNNLQEQSDTLRTFIGKDNSLLGKIAEDLKNYTPLVRNFFGKANTTDVINGPVKDLTIFFDEDTYIPISNKMDTLLDLVSLPRFFDKTLQQDSTTTFQQLHTKVETLKDALVTIKQQIVTSFNLPTTSTNQNDPTTSAGAKAAFNEAIQEIGNETKALKAFNALKKEEQEKILGTLLVNINTCSKFTYTNGFFN